MSTDEKIAKLRRIREEALAPSNQRAVDRQAQAHLNKEYLSHSLDATELVHEAYMRLFGGEQPRYNDRRHFFATAAIAMRRILVEHARRKQAGRRIPAHHFERYGAVFRSFGFVAEQLQFLLQQGDVKGLVIDNQNSCSGCHG